MAPVKRNTNNNTKAPSKLLKTSKQKKTTTRMKYDPQKIVNAMEAVESGTMNVTETSKVFDIPRRTLSDRIKGKYTKAGGGRKTELTEVEKYTCRLLHVYGKVQSSTYCSCSQSFRMGNSKKKLSTIKVSCYKLSKLEVVARF